MTLVQQNWAMWLLGLHLMFDGWLVLKVVGMDKKLAVLYVMIARKWPSEVGN